MTVPRIPRAEQRQTFKKQRATTKRNFTNACNLQYPTQQSVMTVPRIPRAEQRQTLKKQRAKKKRNFTNACNHMRESSGQADEEIKEDELEEIRLNFAKLTTALK